MQDAKYFYYFIVHNPIDNSVFSLNEFSDSLTIKLWYLSANSRMLVEQFDFIKNFIDKTSANSG